VLALLSIVGGWIGLPAHWLWGNRFEHFLAPVFGHVEAEHVSAALEYGLMGVSVAIALVGIGLAYLCYVVQPGLPMLIAWRAKGLYDLLFNKYYIDELYDVVVVEPLRRLANALWHEVDVAVIDGAVNGAATTVSAAGGLWRRWQSGNVQHYALSLFVGAVVVIGYLVWR